MKVVVFAMHGEFSIECIRHLENYQTEIAGIILPAVSGITGKSIPVRKNSPVITFAEENQIPVIEVKDLKSSNDLASIELLEPDYLVAACFPSKIPGQIRALARYGAYNLHPSMLPKYKGPSPLFWQFYYGESDTGITLHEMVDEFDAGPIIARELIPFDDGVSASEASAQLARAGAELVKDHIHKIINQERIEIVENTGGSYQHWPTLYEFVLSNDWQVRRAFNFIKGSLHWNQSFTVTGFDQVLMLKDAISYSYESQQTHVLIQGDRVSIQFSDGVLHALLSENV